MKILLKVIEQINSGNPEFGESIDSVIQTDIFYFAFPSCCLYHNGLYKKKNPIKMVENILCEKQLMEILGVT